MRILITGWQGQIASALVALVPRREDVTSFAVGRPALDLCELPTLQRAMSDARPDVIINAAAYTAVDDAETDRDAAFALNCEGARMLAETAREQNVPLIHLSTDYVFDGALERPYVESDATAPRTVYGQSKLDGEMAIASANPRHIILRTSWVYSGGGKNFVRTMLDKAVAQTSIDVVADQVGSPTYAPHLASAVMDVAVQLADRDETDGIWGVYHAAGSDDASWFDVANAVMKAAGDQGLATATVKPIASGAYPTRAARLTNARLDSRKLAATFGVQLPSWRDGVRQCVAEIASGREI